MTTAAAAREVRELLQEGIERLREARLPTARSDAEWLLAGVLGVERFSVYLGPGRPASAADADRFRALVDRRVAHEPLQYLLGFEDFCGLRLRLTPDVLVPRPETEGLVDWALELMRPRTRPLVADVGTGSGAIACAVAAGHPGATVIAVDISPRALAVAAANAGALGLAARVRLARGDGLDPVRALGVAVDLVIANPPYLPSGIIGSLPREVSRYEPILALDGGTDGMALSRRIIADSGRALRPGGRILLEIGEDQADPLASVMGAAGFVGIECRRDLRGVERYVGARWEGEAVAAPRRPGDGGC